MIWQNGVIWVFNIIYLMDFKAYSVISTALVSNGDRKGQDWN